MTSVERLAARLMACPRTFRFDDAVRVMAWYGFALDGKGKRRVPAFAFIGKAMGECCSCMCPIQVARCVLRLCARWPLS